MRRKEKTKVRIAKMPADGAPLRVLAISVTGAMGGAERSYLEVLRALPRERIAPVACVPPDSPLDRLCAAAEIPVESVNLRRFRRSTNPFVLAGQVKALYQGSRAIVDICKEQKIDLIHGESPFRGLEKTDAKAFREHVENGRRIYYSNCFFCHGDALGGDGMYAHAVNPVPANFQDSGVLPNFQETFFFWRIAKGGPGMPDEGAPGDSVMPEWERFLTNDEIWDVILFLYADTGYRPRTFEEGGEAKH